MKLVMNRRIVLAAVFLVGGIGIATPSVANAPPSGTEQFEEWYAPDGSINGYVHWTCSGDRVVWGTRTGTLVVTRRAC